MQADEARRYSRRPGSARATGSPARPADAPPAAAPTRRSCTGLTTDHSRQTATASTPRSRNRPAIATTAASSSGRTTAPAESIALGHLEGQRPRDIGLGIGDGEVERLGTPALADDEDVGMAFGGEERRPGRAAGQDGVDGPGRAVDEGVGPAEQGGAVDAGIGGRQGQRVEHALDRIRRRGRRLEQLQSPRPSRRRDR